jgi:hypothetical protein
MVWNPTNANDVSLVVSQVERDENGTRTGATTIADTASIVVDEFSIDSDEDLEGLSGVGNPEALGISQGDVEHSFSFTVMGEDATLFQKLASDDGRAVELEIIVRMDDYKDKLTGARAGTRALSGSSGDATEFEVSGIATGRSPGDNTEA